MANEWTCLYCHTSNPLSTRFCTVCNASLLDMERQTLQTRKQETEEIGKKAVVGMSNQQRRTLAFQESETSDVTQAEPDTPVVENPPPRPGDLIGGLFQLNGAAMNGAITPEQYGKTLENVAGRLDGAFEEIISEFEAIPDETGEYIPMLQDMMRSVRFMFETSLEELARYAEDGDPIHIHNGQRLAQKAEMDYIDIARMIQADASLNPFNGQTDVLADLASRVISGRMDVGTYHANLQRLREFIRDEFKKGMALFESGCEKAAQFEGTDEQLLASARQEFQEAVGHLSQVILNLYSPEEVQLALEEIVEETVDRMEEEWEEEGEAQEAE